MTKQNLTTHWNELAQQIGAEVSDDDVNQADEEAAETQDRESLAGEHEFDQPETQSDNPEQVEQKVISTPAPTRRSKERAKEKAKEKAGEKAGEKQSKATKKKRGNWGEIASFLGIRAPQEEEPEEAEHPEVSESNAISAPEEASSDRHAAYVVGEFAPDEPEEDDQEFEEQEFEEQEFEEQEFEEEVLSEESESTTIVIKETSEEAIQSFHALFEDQHSPDDVAPPSSAEAFDRLFSATQLAEQEAGLSENGLSEDIESEPANEFIPSQELRDSRREHADSFAPSKGEVWSEEFSFAPWEDENRPPRRRRRVRRRRGWTEVAADQPYAESEPHETVDEGHTTDDQARRADPFYHEPVAERRSTAAKAEDEDIIDLEPLEHESEEEDEAIEDFAPRRRRRRRRPGRRRRVDVESRRADIDEVEEEDVSGDFDEEDFEDLDETEEDITVSSTREPRETRRGRRERRRSRSQRDRDEYRDREAASPRGRRRESFAEGASEEGSSEAEESKKKHRKIPTWAEAIEIVISANLASRTKSNESRRGRGRRGNR